MKESDESENEKEDILINKENIDIIENTDNIDNNNNKDKIEQMETDKLEDNYSIKEKIIYILKGISSVIASIFHIFGYFSILCLGYTTIYLISFRRHYNRNLNFSYTYCFIPLINLSFSLTAPIGGYIEDKLGGKKAIILSNSILCLSFIIMYFSRSIYLDYLLMLLNGFGIATGFNITKKNACSFFMNRKALICGIINLIPNFFCLVLIMYNEVFILNYKPEYPSIDKKYYSENVFINYQKLILFEIGILIFTGLSAFLLYFQNDPKETAKFRFNEIIKGNENKNEKNEIEKNKKKITKRNKIKKGLYNKRTIELFIMVFLFFPTLNLITNTLRMEEQLYFFFGGLYNIVGCISSIIFGLFGDCVQFRILFSILSILIWVTSFFYVKHFEGEFILFLETLLVSLIYNGFNIIFDSHIMKVYGMENFIEMWGYIRASAGISHLFGIILNSILEINSPKYKIVYSIAGVLSVISFGIGLYETEDKFDYDN